MLPRTGVAVGLAVAEEIKNHKGVLGPRNFSLKRDATEDLSIVLSELWRDLARPGPLWSTIRLVHEGRDLHPSNFMAGALSDGLVAHSYLKPVATADFLTKGATLIYNHLHEASQCIQRIHEVLEYELPARVWIQAYLTTAGESAFGRHNDDHNFVVLQLLGSKNWVLYEDEAAAGRERLLTTGEGAFLRSGTWHAVSGVGELSLHLTIAFDWLSASPEQPGSALNEQELATHHRGWRAGTMLPVALDSATLTPTTLVRTAGRTRPIVTFDNNSAIVQCCAGRFRFDGRLSSVLDKLCDGRETSTEELSSTCGVSRDDLRAFIEFSVRNGILLCG